MIPRLIPLATSAAMAVCIGLAALGANTPARAVASPTGADRCAAALPLVDGTPDLTTSILTQGGYTLALGQYGLHAQGQWMAHLHGTLLPNDVVQEFAFTLPGGAHRYSGLAHSFGHGATRHVCLDQRVWVDHGNGSYAEAHPHDVQMRLDGTIDGNQPYIHGRPGQTDTYIIGASERISVQIGARRYALSGATQTRWAL